LLKILNFELYHLQMKKECLGVALKQEQYTSYPQHHLGVKIIMKSYFNIEGHLYSSIFMSNIQILLYSQVEN
jgi:hypothetical protein